MTPKGMRYDVLKSLSMPTGIYERTEAHKRHMSEALRRAYAEGRHANLQGFSKEHRAKLSAAGKGRKRAPFSDEHRKRIAEGVSRARKGVPLSEKARAAIRQSASERSGPAHAQWTGDAVGYAGLHDWVRRHKKRPDHCEICGVTGRVFNWANVSGEYRRDIDDFINVCVRCHRKMDGLSPAMLSGLETRWRRYRETSHCPQGHPYDEENTYRRRGGRECRQCNRDRARRYHARKRLAYSGKAY